MAGVFFLNLRFLTESGVCSAPFFAGSAPPFCAALPHRAGTAAGRRAVPCTALKTGAAKGANAPLAACFRAANAARPPRRGCAQQSCAREPGLASVTETEGFAVHTLRFSGVFFVGADGNLFQRAEVVGGSVVCALLHGAADAVVDIVLVFHSKGLSRKKLPEQPEPFGLIFSLCGFDLFYYRNFLSA